MADEQFISGWLHKRGGVDASKPWRRRWCVLGDQALHYYKSEQDKEPTGSVYAEDMVGVSCNAEESAKDPKYAYVFEVYTGDRPFMFCANSADEQEEWMGNLRRLLSRDDRIGDDGFQAEMLEYVTVEVFHDKGIRVNGPLPQDTLSQLSQGATSKQKRMDERGWYVEIFVSMHRVIEVLNVRGWRLDQIYHTQGLLPTGPSTCNMLIFSRTMTDRSASMPQFHMAGEDTLLVRGYTTATNIRRNTDISISSDGSIVRDQGTTAKGVVSPLAEEE